MDVTVTGRIEVATIKPDRRGHDCLLVGLRCRPQPDGLSSEALVWERFSLDDPRGVQRAVHFGRAFGVELTPEDLTLEAIDPVLRALRRAAPRPVMVAHETWANGQGSSWRVTGFALTPSEAKAFAERHRALLQSVRARAQQSDEDLPF